MSKVFEEFGVFDIDTFASGSNTKGRRFFSKFDSPASSGMDFFHQRLRVTDSHFCFPPTSLLAAAVGHFKM